MLPSLPFRDFSLRTVYHAFSRYEWGFNEEGTAHNADSKARFSHGGKDHVLRVTEDR